MPERPSPPQPESDDRFRELVTRQLEGALTPAELAELDALLQGDARRTEYFFSRHVLASTLAECGEAWLQEMPAEATPTARSTAQPAAPPETNSLLQASYWQKRRVRFGALALALTLMFWAGVGYVVIPRLGGPGIDPETSPVGLAQVTSMRGVAWAPGGTGYALEQALNGGDTLALEAGFVEIRFAGGAVVLLEGPAEFVVDGRTSGTLKNGQLVARLDQKPGGGLPFAVFTPEAQVIDLGTEFGLLADPDGTTNVHVFEGRVEVTARGNSRQKPQPLRLSAGQSAQLRPGQEDFELKDLNADQFIQQIPEFDTEILAPVAFDGIVSSEALINGSGLDATGPIRSWTHHAEEPGTNEVHNWASGVRHLPQEITFDLGEVRELSAVWIWNYSHLNPADYSGRSTSQVRVEVSLDGQNFETRGVLNLAEITSHPNRGERFTLRGPARYVRFVILDSHAPLNAPDRQNSEIGLGEVRFEAVVENTQPSTPESREEATP